MPKNAYQIHIGRPKGRMKDSNPLADLDPAMRRAHIEAQVRAYQRKGGKIQCIPDGVTGFKPTVNGG